jgi:hypothetical protein
MNPIAADDELLNTQLPVRTKGSMSLKFQKPHFRMSIIASNIYVSVAAECITTSHEFAKSIKLILKSVPVIINWNTDSVAVFMKIVSCSSSFISFHRYNTSERASRNLVCVIGVAQAAYTPYY